MTVTSGWSAPDPDRRDRRLPVPANPLHITIGTGGKENDPAAIGDNRRADGLAPDRPGAIISGVEAATAEASGWQLGWDPAGRTLYARHVTNPGGPNESITRWYGTTRGAFPTVAALEQQLGFALPDSARRWLNAQTGAAPAPPVAGVDRALEDRRPPGPGETPGPHDLVAVPGRDPARYAVALADQPVVHAYTDGAQTLELLDAAQTTVTGDSGTRWPRWALTYRLRAGHEVICAGDDITVPADADPASDQTLRHLGWALTACPAVQPTARQQTWLAAHGQRFWAALAPPGELTEGMHVEFDTVDGPPALGRITSVVGDDRTGVTRGFFVRPDVADLPGHPWADTDATVFVRAGHVREAQLRDIDRGLDPTRPLPYLTQVTYQTFDGDHATGEVLRAFAATGQRPAARYDLRALDGPDRDQVVTAVPADTVQPQRGAWWVAHHDLVAARLADDVLFVAGEVLQGVHDPTALHVTAVEPDGTPRLEPIPSPSTDWSVTMASGVAPFDLSALRARARVTLDEAVDHDAVDLQTGMYQVVAPGDGNVTIVRPDRQPVTVPAAALAAAYDHTGSIPGAADHAAGLDVEGVGL